MSTKTVKLTFTAPVHFGDGRLSSSKCTCDAATLFSAFYLEALRMGIQDDLLAAVQSGNLLISDTFPFIGDTYYLPKPMVQAGVRVLDKNLMDDTADSVVRKASKKLAFIPVSQYGNYLEGTFDPVNQADRFKLGESSVQTKVNLTRAHKDDAEPYHVGGFSFYPNTGLYFIVLGSYDIEPLLEQLSYSGLGGERSSGYGRFAYVIERKNPLDKLPQSAADNQLCVLLSSAAPKESELSDDLLEESFCRVVRKGGFVGSVTHSVKPQKKRDLYVFAAGSVFARKFDGDIFDVNATAGAHSVYRYARAMWAEV